MKIRTTVPGILAIAGFAAALAAPLAAGDSSSIAPLATTGYTAPSAGAAQSAASATRADRASRADRADRAEVAARLDDAAVQPPQPVVPTGYICGREGKPRCGDRIALGIGLFVYSCRKQIEGEVTSGTFTVRMNPAYIGSASCGDSTGNGLLRGLSGTIYWVKRIG